MAMVSTTPPAVDANTSKVSPAPSEAARVAHKPGHRYRRLLSYADLLREAAKGWSAHRASSMGAALAFYATFSIAPILVIAIAIAGAIFGPEAARGEVVAEISGLTGEAGAETIQGLLEGAYHSDLGFWASMIAVATLLVAATSVFAELKDSLDIIWGAAPAKSGLQALLRGRLLAFGLILTMGFLLIVSLVASAVIAALQNYWGGWIADSGWLLELVNSLFSFVVVSIMFASIYKLLPATRIAWRDVAVGALVTSALFTLGKFLIGLYLGNSDIASGFGAAGSLIVILLWVYYSSQIFFMGAEFTRVYAVYRGSHSGRSAADAAPAAG
jgi:membrane protein